MIRKINSNFVFNNFMIDSNTMDAYSGQIYMALFSLCRFLPFNLWDCLVVLFSSRSKIAFFVLFHSTRARKIAAKMQFILWDSGYNVFALLNLNVWQTLEQMHVNNDLKKLSELNRIQNLCNSVATVVCLSLGNLGSKMLEMNQFRRRSIS